MGLIGRGSVPVFIGRGREVVAVQSGLSDADARLVLVVGDAGIGKTRLVTEALANPSGADRRTLTGACLPMAETLSLLPLVEAFRTLDADRDSRSGLRAVLADLPAYVGREVTRLLPELGDATAAGTRDDEGVGTRQRLFAAVVEVLAVVSAERPTALLIEDVHWADDATLDLLTYVLHSPRLPSLTVVATSRSDEPSCRTAVLDWLAHVRRSPTVVEVRVPPLTAEEVAAHAVALVGGPVGADIVAELCARGEGSPFFTEQLVAAALDDRGQHLHLPARLPGGLAELLARRWAAVSPVSRTALAALAVAGRPLAEEPLARVADADPAVVRVALTELARARLLGPADTTGGLRPRHALLAEAVVEELLPGERAALHARTAEVLEQSGDPALAGEVAAHWAAAGRPADELRATVTAARTAMNVSGFLDAAGLSRRAIQLSDELPEQARRLGIGVPRLYLDAADALEAAGEGVQASLLAEEAYRRFADWPDDAVAAAVIARAAHFRLIWSTQATDPLFGRALRLFEHGPPSHEQAEALLGYALKFHGEGRRQAGIGHLHRAVAIAEAVGARATAVLALLHVASAHLVAGDRAAALAAVDRARHLAGAAEAEDDDRRPAVILAAGEGDLLLKQGELRAAREVSATGVDQARRSGRGNSFHAWMCVARMAEASRELGDTESAVAVLTSVRADAPHRDRWLAQAESAMAELLGGRLHDGVRRLAAVRGLEIGGNLELSRPLMTKLVTAALWSDDARRAGAEVEAALGPLVGTEQEVFAGELLSLGARACADVAEAARARRNESGVSAAGAGLARLVGVASAMGGRPFTDHPLLVRIPGDRADWAAERARAEGADDPALWVVAATVWQGLERPHRAAYAWWRCAEAHLLRGNGRSAAEEPLRAASVAAAGFTPLRERVTALARRARVVLEAAPPPVARTPTASPDHLTDRELLVLHLVARGRTNAQIGAELFMSPKTASVHITNILRKLGVGTRTQAAAVAERAGLLEGVEPR